MNSIFFGRGGFFGSLNLNHHNSKNSTKKNIFFRETKFFVSTFLFANKQNKNKI